MRQMTFSHISQKSAQETHTEENKKSMKMIGPWRGWSVSEPPKGAYHIVCTGHHGASRRVANASRRGEPLGATNVGWRVRRDTRVRGVAFACMRRDSEAHAVKATG